MPETISCPKCQGRLRVPAELQGKPVKCPKCGTTFIAEAAALPAASEPLYEEVAVQPPSVRPPRPLEDRAEYDEQNDDYPKLRRRLRGGAPHRGTLILVLGILSLAICGLFGPVAWILGNNDLAEMDSGRMDPEGRGMTQGGRICGMISSAFMILGCLVYGLAFLAMGAGALR